MIKRDVVEMEGVAVSFLLSRGSLSVNAVARGFMGTVFINCDDEGTAASLWLAFGVAARSGGYEIRRFFACPCQECLLSFLESAVPDDLRPEDADERDLADWWKSGDDPPEYGEGEDEGSDAEDDPRDEG